LANVVMRVPGIVHIARWVAGVDQRRSLPAFASTRFGRLTAGRRTANQNKGNRNEGNRVLLWVDSFTEYFSTGPGLAMIQVLESAVYTVEPLAKRQGCGLTWIRTGQLDHARRLCALPSRPSILTSKRECPLWASNLRARRSCARMPSSYSTIRGQKAWP